MGGKEEVLPCEALKVGELHLDGSKSPFFRVLLPFECPSVPPHIIVDASRRFAVFSDQFIAIPPRHIGIAGTKANESLLRILSLLLSSDFCTYHQFLTSPQWGIDATRADHPAARSLKTIRDRLRKRHSQWVYFDRALKVYDRGVLYQFKPMQRLHWTRRQAVLDADDIIAETLSAKDLADSAVS